MHGRLNEGSGTDHRLCRYDVIKLMLYCYLNLDCSSRSLSKGGVSYGRRIAERQVFTRLPTYGRTAWRDDSMRVLCVL